MGNFTTDTATGLPSRNRKGMKVMTNVSKGKGKSAKATKTEDRRIARTSRQLVSIKKKRLANIFSTSPGNPWNSNVKPTTRRRLNLKKKGK